MHRNAECIINININTNIININININIIIIIIMIIMRLWLWPEIDFGMNHRAEMHQSGWLPIRKKYKTFSSFIAGKMMECGPWRAKSYSNFLFCPEAKEEDYKFRLCMLHQRWGSRSCASSTMLHKASRLIDICEKFCSNDRSAIFRPSWQTAESESGFFCIRRLIW